MNPIYRDIKALSEAISRHQEPSQPPQKPDAQAEQERQDLSKHEKKQRAQDLARRNLQNKLLEDLIKTRKEYSEKIFTFLGYWSLGLVYVLILQGFPLYGFSIPESVLGILAGSTTVNIIALVGLVVKGLFPSQNQQP